MEIVQTAARESDPVVGPPGSPGRPRHARTNKDEDLQRLVAPHLSRLLEVAERILGSGEEAEDAVQEALVTLWRARVTPPNPRGWLVRTVVHRSLHARRTAQRRRKWEERAGSDWATTCPLCDPCEAVEAAQLQRRLGQALEGLSDDHRIVVALRAEGLDYQEIAGRLGVPVGTIRSRLNRAREALRSELGRSE
ncbi:MAG: RNA polymerase sigma factor [Myxococcota bacterium]